MQGFVGGLRADVKSAGPVLVRGADSGLVVRCGSCFWRVEPAVEGGGDCLEFEKALGVPGM